MISERELLEIIDKYESSCETLADCEKLAVYYTVYDHLFGKDNSYGKGYSQKSEGQREEKEKISVPLVTSEFLRLAEGMDAKQFWGVVDELVSTIEVINPRLYESFLRKLKETA